MHFRAELCNLNFPGEEPVDLPLDFLRRIETKPLRAIPKPARAVRRTGGSSGSQARGSRPPPGSATALPSSLPALSDPSFEPSFAPLRAPSTETLHSPVNNRTHLRRGASSALDDCTGPLEGTDDFALHFEPTPKRPRSHRTRKPSQARLLQRV